MAHVCIVMATRDGGRHIAEQLASFAAQTHSDWSLLVSDDGSDDDTLAQVEAFAARHPGHDVRIVAGPAANSAAANFLTAIAHPESGRPDSFVALSDQDDIWMPHRLEHALAALGEASGPAVYASRTMICDARGRARGASRRHPRGPSFGNALVQNILPGNTIMLDPAVAMLVRETAEAARGVRAGRGVAHHDWWIYSLATGIGATVILDDRPGLHYRQHGQNLMGAHRGLMRSADRLTMVHDGRYADWVTGNVEALGALEHRLLPATRQLRQRFSDWLGGAAMPFAELRRAGIVRQTPVGDMLLAAMARGGLLQGRAPGAGRV